MMKVIYLFFSALLAVSAGDPFSFYQEADYFLGYGLEQHNNGSCNASCPIQLGTAISTNVVLTGVSFFVTVTLPPFIDNKPLPDEIIYRYSMKDGGSVIDEEDFFSRTGDGPTFSFGIKMTFNSSGSHVVNFTFSNSSNDPLCTCSDDMIQSMNIFAIPGPVTLLPPILTAVVAIVFRQVLIALLLGIWLCALFAYRLNPLVATLRTIDTYFVNSVANFDHSAIVVFTFFLGGLIGVVQKSGGGLGLASLLRRLTGSRRRASFACIILGALIFFDDYSLVLIVGTSFREMMANAKVSKEKYAYILKSLGPTLPSLIPISSWIGVQVGNLQDALNNRLCSQCPNLDIDPFVLTISTIPYRFFPILLIFTIILIAALNRDFGIMLTAERAMIPPPPSSTSSSSSSSSSVAKIYEASRSVMVQESSHDDKFLNGNEKRGQVELRGAGGSSPAPSGEVIYEGPLAPKKNVPYRWFNAAIPFLITMLVTLIGMILDGWQNILAMPEGKRLQMTLINIFTKADAVAALIWASALACVVSMVMLLIQRILTLKEYMDSWIEGVKDIIEPFMVLWLAWALGAAIQDIQTTNYIAKALTDGGFSYKYIPALVTIIGFLMSFAAGSAFGTMGILFPLVIPTVCSISDCDKEAVLQSSAAILASSLFGNVVSPIAGICILTVFASQCELVPHIKSTSVYAIILAVISVLFGALPVGAGWYPVYAAWPIMLAVVVIIFVLFSSNTDSHASIPLLKHVCPWIYSVPAHFNLRINNWWTAKGYVLGCKLAFIKCCRRRTSSVSMSVDADDERTPLI